MSVVLDRSNQPQQSNQWNQYPGQATGQSSEPVYPNPGEDYRSFIQRAHYSLIASIPDPDTRNEIVWDAWDAVYGNPLREQSLDYFPPEKYRAVPNVCYFMEHQTVGRDGTALNYDFNGLADLMDEGNQRVDTNCYSAEGATDLPTEIVPTKSRR